MLGRKDLTRDEGNELLIIAGDVMRDQVKCYQHIQLSEGGN